MADKIDFDVNLDQVIFTTQTNGDRIEIKDINLSADEAGNLAHMVNNGRKLRITIKEA